MAAIELVRTYDARHPQGTPDSESGSAEGGGPTAGSGPGHTFLIDRLWPRGIAKTELTFDSWITDIAPSTELRKWFDHDPAKFDEFRARYRSELDANPGPASPILAAIGNRPVRLLYSAKDTEHNQAVVLKEWLLEH